MKWKVFLGAVLVIMAFFLLSRLIPAPKKTSGSVNYSPDGYKKTIKASIKGVVSDIKQEGLFWVFINSRKFPFSYDVYKLPEGWENSYPSNFIQVKDSIYKNANSDTFYLFRGNQSWQYFLPE
jgi:hypothetical protein